MFRTITIANEDDESFQYLIKGQFGLMQAGIE